jgi:DNA-binding NarL/FixJ family response regulator
MEVAGEYATLGAARAADVDADAILVGSSLGPEDADEPTVDEPLTPREIEVLELLAEGLPNKAIAGRLGISDQTVKFHVSSISGKLRASNRTDAVRKAVRRGLITL